MVRERVEVAERDVKDLLNYIPYNFVKYVARARIELKDGTKILGFSWDQEERGNTRGYSNIVRI